MCAKNQNRSSPGRSNRPTCRSVSLAPAMEDTFRVERPQPVSFGVSDVLTLLKGEELPWQSREWTSNAGTTGLGTKIPHACGVPLPSPPPQPKKCRCFFCKEGREGRPGQAFLWTSSSRPLLLLFPEHQTVYSSQYFLINFQIVFILILQRTNI